jgi:16S rRNA (adenine1518-N6/adenine1519-N6)-dimethyltransferase
MESNVEKILKEYGLDAEINTLNQHFLIDKELLKRMVDADHVCKEDVVLEIGPGLGMLTELLANKARFMHSIELDKRFRPILDKIAEKHSNLSIVFGNAIKIEWPKFNKLVSAIPYNIAEPLLLKLMEQDKFDSCTLVVSKHFADLLTNDSESRLSIIAPAFFKVILLEIIPPSSFYPQPKVDSALIVIKPLEKDKLVAEPIKYLIRELFWRRDKKLKNALREAMIAWTLKVKGKQLTKRGSREFIQHLKLEPEMADKLIDNLSGKEFKFLENMLKNRIDGIYAYCK